MLGSVAVAAQKNDDVENLNSAVVLLETKPLDKKAKKAGKKAFRFVAETDKVSVVICTDLAEPFLDKKNKLGSEMLLTYTLSMAAFKLKNPENNTENDAQVAGVESALKAYETAVKLKSKYKYAPIDELIRIRDGDGLAAHYKDVVCA